MSSEELGFQGLNLLEDLWLLAWLGLSKRCHSVVAILDKILVQAWNLDSHTLGRVCYPAVEYCQASLFDLELGYPSGNRPEGSFLGIYQGGGT